MTLLFVALSIVPIVQVESRAGLRPEDLGGDRRRQHAGSGDLLEKARRDKRWNEPAGDRLSRPFEPVPSGCCV